MPYISDVYQFVDTMSPSNNERVTELYRRRLSKPCSLVVIHPSIESMKVYADAYRHLQDYFVFDESLPNCDFDMIPNNVPILMIGPGDRTGILAREYNYYVPIKKMRYLVKPAYYREYYEAVTGLRYMDNDFHCTLSEPIGNRWSAEYVSRVHYETGLRDRKNILGFWPYSVQWAEWHGLSGIFCGDIILNMNSASMHGFRILSDEDMQTEQLRLTNLLKAVISTWPSHSLNIEALDELSVGSTIISEMNNKNIYLVSEGKIVKNFCK